METEKLTMSLLNLERAMGIEQIQSTKTRRYCPLFNSIGVKLESGYLQRETRGFL